MSRFRRRAQDYERLPDPISNMLNASRHQRKNRMWELRGHSDIYGAQRLAASEEKSLRASNPPGIHLFAIQVASITPLLRIFGGAGRN
jgi:hypothetical protein